MRFFNFLIITSIFLITINNSQSDLIPEKVQDFFSNISNKTKSGFDTVLVKLGIRNSNKTISNHPVTRTHHIVCVEKLDSEECLLELEMNQEKYEEYIKIQEDCRRSGDKTSILCTVNGRLDACPKGFTRDSRGACEKN
ncbi:hypothetical protein PVAND_013933 [Polypedilum vanderplanki]|uniref:Uncharacterized protein n=1 Tax=Polypedilum vanderplanki TaxID=319348 RepID=A0A9J6CS81_POLVA|nr:hypothetical protein PVAND_013933 [Polypedilum vanderplanki]